MESEPFPWNDAIARVRVGDEAAARMLIDQLYPKVIRIVRSHLPRRMDEEDLAQEVFIKVFTRIDQFRGSQPFDHWVARIALFTCYDRLRQQKVRPEFGMADLSEREAEFIENTLAGKAVDDGVEAGELATELVERLLATLNEREQVVIRLIDLEEHSIAEVVELTGWGESKVKVTAHRARKKLREALRRIEARSEAGVAIPLAGNNPVTDPAPPASPNPNE